MPGAYVNPYRALLPEYGTALDLIPRKPYPGEAKKLLLLGRHATSWGNIWPEAYAFKDDRDLGLTPEGVVQAQSVGEEVAAFLRSLHAQGIPIGHTKIFYSPSFRAKETAKCVAGAVSRFFDTLSDCTLSYCVDPDLIERQRGLFSGYSDQRCETFFPEEWAAYQNDMSKLGAFDARPPQGESLRDVSVRMQRVARKIDEDNADTIILIFHSTSGRIFDGVLKGDSTPEHFVKKPGLACGAFDLYEKIGGKWTHKGNVVKGYETTPKLVAAHKKRVKEDPLILQKMLDPQSCDGPPAMRRPKVLRACTIP